LLLYVLDIPDGCHLAEHETVCADVARDCDIGSEVGTMDRIQANEHNIGSGGAVS
jgi:hypothetical protein